MKKVFFIINSFSWGGGAEALLTQIVNNLNPQKYKIGIMEIIHADIKKEPVNNNIEMYPYYVKANDPERKSKMYYVYHEWDNVIQKYVPQDYDLYVSFNYLKPSFLLPKGKKNIAWIHGDVYNLADPDMEEEKVLQNKAFYKANKIVSISDITTQSLIDLFPEHREKLQIIYNGIDVKKIRQMAKQPTDIQLHHPSILSVGRLDENKNPLRLLRIFEKIYQSNKKIHLYYLGYGRLDKDINRISEEKEMQDNVHLLGYHDNPFPIMAQCDVNCMFSLSEGFGLGIAEGLCLGVPFVGTDVGAFKRLSNNGKCGKTVDTDDDAAKAISELLQEDKQQISQECRQSIKRFELNTYMQQIESLFDKVMEE